MKKFKFFDDKQDTEDRLPAIVEQVRHIVETRENRDIIVPETITNPLHRDCFRAGWIACRAGQNIWDCPYETRSYIRNWEYGWTSYYNTSNRRHEIMEYEDLFRTGFNAAREGYPKHDNPWDLPTTQYQKRVWDEGWDDFTNNH